MLVLVGLFPVNTSLVWAQDNPSTTPQMTNPSAKIDKIAEFSESLRLLGLPSSWIDELPPSAIQLIVFTEDSRPEFHPNTRNIVFNALLGPKTRLTLPVTYENLYSPGSIGVAPQLSPKDIATIVHELWHSYWNWINHNSPDKNKFQIAARVTIKYALERVQWTKRNERSATQGEIIFDEAVAEYVQSLYIDMINYQRNRLEFGTHLSGTLEDTYTSRWQSSRTGPQLGYSKDEAKSTGKVNLPTQIRQIIETLLGIPENISDLPPPNEVHIK